MRMHGRGLTTALLALVLAASIGSAQARSPDREGGWFTIGPGTASLSCDWCPLRGNGLASQFAAG